MTQTIEQLEDLLKNSLVTSSLESVTIKKLTAPGENYGSLMLGLEVSLKNDETGKKKKLHMVAKKIPPTELFQEIFNIQVIFKKEVSFYATIVPTLKSFCDDMGVENILNCFPEFYGARFNLRCDDTLVDDHAVMLLENLATSGFSNIDRFEGFDMNSTKLILKDLAELHATALALKIKKPETFNSKVKNHCHEYVFPHEIMENYREVTRMVLRENSKCADLADKIKLLGEQPRGSAREPWATLVHRDLWTNNTMQKYQDGEAIANRFIDFQLFSYGSPASDVFFFLWSSVSRSILRDNFDLLVEYYYDQFTNILAAFDCHVTPLSLTAFMEEMKMESLEYEFGHAIVFSTLIVNGKKRSTEMGGIPDQNDLFRNVPDEAKRKAWFMAEECARRGWI